MARTCSSSTSRSPVSTRRQPARSRRVSPPALAPAVLWVTFVFTGLVGIQRGFLLERENDCLAGLLTAPVDPASIYAGKLAANVALLAVVEAVVVPLVGLFLHVDLWPALT